MTADKTHLRILVKDDLSRFSIRIAELPTTARDTRTDRGFGENRAESLIGEGFDRIGLFQRYPNILETCQAVFQQLNKNI